MAWIESHQNLEKNGKLLTLANELQINRYQAIGHLHALWWWALDNAEDGNIGRFSEDVITQAAGWDEYVEKDWRADTTHCLNTTEAYALFIPALIKTGFLDPTPQGLMIHAWEMYTHRYFKSVTKSAEQREKVRERVRRHRRSNAGVTQVKRDVTPPTVPNRTIPNQTKDNYKDNDSARARPDLIQPTDFKPPAVTDKTRNGTHAPIARLVGPHVDFVRKFGESYEAMTNEPFKAGNKAYEIAKQLIDRYGAEAVEKKAKILGRMCADQTAWFTKDGWADFTIEKISVQWNSIIATYKETPEDKKRREDLEALKKVREKNERANEAIRRYGAGTGRR